MKKFSAIIALALLAVAGTGYAVTCAYDNVPAATLLVPYFRVSRNGTTSVSTDLPDAAQQVDTLCAVTNVSNTGLVLHIVVWNKYTQAVLDFNVPMTAYDVVTWRMRDILNGKLNINQTQSGSIASDPCGINQTTGVYNPSTGFGATTYIRFANPNSADARQSISRYATPAFSGNFRRNVWDSLDESGDVTSFASPGANVIDDDNTCSGSVDGTFSGDFSGYLTIDVVNYCTNFFPNQAEFFTNDAIATRGWSASGYTPNALIGDVFYVDSNLTNNNISGDQMVALEFDQRLNWVDDKTFYGRYDGFESSNGTGPAPEKWRYTGDGREPLGTHYGFRYLNNATIGLRSWAIVWRGDIYNNPNFDGDVDLCDWWAEGGPDGFGLFDSLHKLAVSTYDENENQFVTGGGPSPGQGGVDLYVFLETQRIDLFGNGDIIPGGQAAYPAGWIDITFPGTTFYNQAYVGIQHSGTGVLLSVGHSATLLNNQFTICVAEETDVHDDAGNIP